MDSAPGLELFESYESDYSQLASSIKNKLDVEVKEKKGESKKTLLRAVQRELEEADEIVAQMDVELQGLADRNQKSKLQVKTRGYKGELTRQKNEVKKLLNSADREELFSGSFTSSTPLSDRSSASTTDQRARLLQGTQILSDGQRRLEASHREALETEDVGTQILRDLRGQREQIERTRDTLGTADENIDRSSGTLSKMIRRMYQQRIITVVIIIVLVFLIGIVLWAKFR